MPFSRTFLAAVQAGEDWADLAPDQPRHLQKMLVIQELLALSEAEVLEEVDDRASLRRFCGMSSSDPLPTVDELRDCRRQLDTTRPWILASIAARWVPSAVAEPLLSIVSPVYRAEHMVDEFVRLTIEAAGRITPDFELVLVEDGSPDGTWARIAAICAADPRVKGVKLSRNFGQHPSITAGLHVARGRWVAVMDCDLQDDPAFLVDLIAKARDGYDVVLSSRNVRAHGWFKNVLGRAFTSVLNRLSGAPAADPMIGGYSMLSRRAVEAFKTVGDVHRHYLLIVRWLGFDSAYVPVVHHPRQHGRSSYSVMKLLRHAINGWVSHSNRLLYASVGLGFAFLAAAITGALLVITLYFTRGFADGWPSLAVLILTGTGSILISMGVLGIYVGKIFDQVRARPLFIIERQINVPGAGHSRSE